MCEQDAKNLTFIILKMYKLVKQIVLSCSIFVFLENPLLPCLFLRGFRCFDDQSVEAGGVICGFIEGHGHGDIDNAVFQGLYGFLGFGLCFRLRFRDRCTWCYDRSVCECFDGSAFRMTYSSIFRFAAISVSTCFFSCVIAFASVRASVASAFR